MLRVCPYIDTVQKAVTCSMRGVLVDWLVEVAEEYELSSETLYLSVNFLDRFLSQEVRSRSNLLFVSLLTLPLLPPPSLLYRLLIDANSNWLV